jgi:hypothetical protein
MSWPPNEREWPELLRALPLDADRPVTRRAIEAAVQEYLGDADRDERLRAVYQQIEHQSGARSVDKLCEAILQLNNFPLDADAEALLRNVEHLKRMRPLAEVRATIYLARDAAKAQSYFERALAVARQQQAKSWELRAAMSMARLWRDQGKRDEARELLAPVYGWFTEGFDTLDLKEAKVLLDELAS